MAEEDNAPPQDSLTTYNDVVETPTNAVDNSPVYRMMGENKIPVSKHRGKLWKSRLGMSRSATKKNREAWKEAIRYYHHDQQANKDGSDATDATSLGARIPKETENMVFANISALVPMLYTKNPDAEFTAQSEDTEPLAATMQKLMKKLASQKCSPGINLKPKIKRAIVLTCLCNCAWIEVGYTFKEQSSEAAQQDLQRLSQALQDAKSQDDIKTVEGELIALENKIDLLTPAGPWAKLRRPWQVYIDPDATDLDLADAGWAIVEDMVPTSYLKAMFYARQEDSEQYASIYNPTHVMKGGAESADDTGDITGDNFVLFDKAGADSAQHGYGDEKAFKRAQCTKVYYVWDKATRRCELYSDADWTYPVWVWDDPYHLDQFFPLQPMQFHTDPTNTYAKGEVVYYMDQQDTLNIMNNEFNRIRSYASSLVGYNKNIIKNPGELDDFLRGTQDKRTMGFDIPEGMKLSDVLGAVLPPSAEAAKFFDKRGTLESIDRISGVSSVQRGVEYKTNTTNRAIESYESQMQTRADEKMDAIEECVGGVLWMVGQMCLQFMTEAEVQQLIGTSEGWQNMDPRDIVLQFVPRVVGGSSLKPTSRSKKEQAMQISQVVGNFAKATPVAVIIALKVLETAFSGDVVIDKEDWDMLIEGVQSGIQQQQAQVQSQSAAAAASRASAQQPQQAPQPGQAGPPPAQGQVPQGGPDSNTQGTGQDVGGVIQRAVTEASQLLDQLPPEVKQAIGVMLARGQPVQQIAATIISKLDGPQG